MISNAASKGQKELPVSQVGEMLDQQVSSADDTRATNLSGLSQIRAAKQAGLARDQARLAQKYGPDDPRVQQMSARIAVNQKLTQTLTTEVERANTQPVPAEADMWILHGRVFDSKHNPAPDLTVALYNKKGVWYEKAGHACTDRTGYFRLELGKDAVPGTNQDTKPTGAPRPSERVVTNVSVSLQLYVHVTDRHNKTLAVDDRTLTPELGTVDYIEIVLGETAPAGADCAPPKETKARGAGETTTSPAAKRSAR